MVSNNETEVIKLRKQVREEILVLKTSRSMTWEDWNQEVSEITKENRFTKFTFFTQFDRWQKLISSQTTGSSKSLQWWIDLQQIVDLIKVKKFFSFTKKQEATSNNLHGHSVEAIRYSVSKFQDTILPLLYKHAYSLKLKVSFKPNYDWNKCLEAFKSGDIDVALHNFPTVLAYIKEMQEKSCMFFFPFFTFYGYAIFVRTSAIEKFATENNSAKNFGDWKNSEKKKFFLENKILLERNTDVEWVLKKYLEKFGCKWEDVEKANNIIPCGINSGKIEFKRKSSIAVYCTNSMHIADLRKQSDKYEAVAKGKELTHHQNYNGLICTMEYFEQHPEIIKELIEIWFNNIQHFKEEWDLISDTDDDDGFTNFHINALLEKLNQYTSSNISIPDLIESYRKFNHFFNSPQEAFNSFMQNVLDKPNEVDNNFEISNIQSPGSATEVDKTVTEKIRQQMIEVKKQMNF